MKQQLYCALLLATFLIGFMQPQTAPADKICLKAAIKSGKVKLQKKQVAGAKCPSGYLALIDTAVFGQSIYGSSAAPSITYSSDTTLPAGSMEFNNFTVQSGVTLSVPSGTVIRCWGTFTNNGSIIVTYGAPGGFAASDEMPLHGYERVANSGISAASAAWGECFTAPNGGAHGGSGGVGISKAAATLLRYPGANAGGASGLYGDGGGSLVVLAKAGISNNGVITADGKTDLGAGGGGGVIILASSTSVINAGTLNARGGAGGAADVSSNLGAGGGGGGGIVHLIAPTLQTGTYSVAGGAGGAEDAHAPGPSYYCAGAGGGASGGNGGAGGSTTTKAWAGTAGSEGYFITTQTDPAPLF